MHTCAHRFLTAQARQLKRLSRSVAFMKMNAPCLTSEAARLLRASEDSVRRWADAGLLRVVRTAAGLRVFDREELERFAAEREAKAK